MLTTIEQFAGKDIWVYAELDYEDAYIRVEKVFEDGTVLYNAWLPSDSLGKYDIDEILYGELTGDVDSIEIHPLDTITTDELLAKIKADGKISGCSKVTSSRKCTKHPRNYARASMDDGLTIDDMVDYINAEWENLGCGEKMTRREAEEYLGHSVKGMSKADIDEEVSELQKAYYVDGDIAGASDQEIIDMYNWMIAQK